MKRIKIILICLLISTSIFSQVYYKVGICDKNKDTCYYIDSIRLTNDVGIIFNKDVHPQHFEDVGDYINQTILYERSCYNDSILIHDDTKKFCIVEGDLMTPEHHSKCIKREHYFWIHKKHNPRGFSIFYKNKEIK